MSKLRIYELAKELGVENKVIIAKASEIGMSGKLSHSSSLESHEADQIRRSILRETMGVDAKAQVASSSRESERLTTRIDKFTGEAQAIVESRKGNVIRRRRQPGSEAGSDDGGAVQSVESVHAAVLPEMEVHEPMLARAEEERVVAEAIVHELPVTEAVMLEPVVAEPEPETLPVEPEEPEATVPEIPPAATNGHSAAPVRSVPAAAVVTPPKKAVIGPRVLGKIELPQAKKPVVAKPEAAKGEPPRTRSAQDMRAALDEEEQESSKKKAAKKGRKREISRIDLIDYESRDGRRAGPRPKGRSKESASDFDRQSQLEQTRPKASKRVVQVNEVITVGELARQMSLKSGDVIAKLIELGVMATINQAIDLDTATVVAEEFDFQVESTKFDESSILEDQTPEDMSRRVVRAPVVTVMGHVDHGKTSLLDTIRKAAVAEKEHGGITQHIGAYQVQVPAKGAITFIDTPGHAAFTSMRARGAKITDIVVLVVAADDGVMPQTIEAINHAKAANVPIVVAVNKVDKPEAQPDRIRQQLVEHGLQPEDWGGDTMFFNVSALKKQGIAEMLEGLLLVAEVRELRANPDRRARGTIIEAKQEKGKGTVATVLVQNGTLRVGDVFVAGAEFGRIRSMVNDGGDNLTEAGPSVPVEITGMTGIPDSGDDFFVVETEAKAREVAEQRAHTKQRHEQRIAAGPISLEEFAKRANNLAAEELNVILKTDVHGSLEAVQEALERLSTPKVKVRVLHAAVGGINESDVQLAIASKAIVIGFGVRAEARALQEAESLGVELRFYRIIYELLDDVKKAMAGLLAPIRQEVRTGRVEIRETFNIPKAGTVAGCYVVDGVIKRASFVRLLRDSRVVHEGKLASLKRFKDDVREVQMGYECGLMLEGYNDVKNGDTLEVFDIKEVAASID